MKIRAENVTKTFRDADKELTVISDLSIEFAVGKATAMVGRSGIGKSTLLHLLGTLERPSSGKVIYGDTEITSLNDEQLSELRGREIGFIFQFHYLLPEFTALENVAMPLIIAGDSEAEATSVARAALEHVSLQDRLEHRPGELSGGEQQRVSIARAIVRKPSVVFADEPTGNLDIETARDVQKLLLGLREEIGTTLIIATHDLELASCMDIVLEMVPGGGLNLKV